MKKVSDIMTRDVQSVAPDTDVVTVARYMRDLNVGSIPVVEQNRLLGIVTDRDLVIRLLADGKNPQTEKIRTYITPNPTTVSSEDDVDQATSLMAQHQIRRLPVVDQGRLVGFLSLGDVAVDVGKDKLSGDALEQISEPSAPRSKSLGN